jgi:hypothetical protein
MIPQRQQPAYDPMAQMMQILQFALGQNQQVQQQANQDRNFGLEQEQLAMQGQRYDQQYMQQIAAQQAEQEYRQQQAANTQRGLQLDERKLGLGEQEMNQRALMQQEEQKQRLQQAVMMALGRVENADGFQDPTLLYQYLQQQGIQLPGMQAQPTVDPMAAERAKAQAFMSQLGQ